MLPPNADLKYIDALYQLEPVEFDYKNNGTHAIGLIAEQVNDFIPEVVVKNPTDTSLIEGVIYEHLVPVLISIIKQHEQKINSLEQRLAILENNNTPR